METLIKKETGQSQQLEKLRELLPKHYYGEFRDAYKKKQKDNPPTRQMVFLVLTGKAENHKILDILIDMADKRNEVKSRLAETLSYANGQDSKAAD